MRWQRHYATHLGVVLLQVLYSTYQPSIRTSVCSDSLRLRPGSATRLWEDQDETDCSGTSVFQRQQTRTANKNVTCKLMRLSRRTKQPKQWWCPLRKPDERVLR
ncbi:hypothetical protein B0T24DRAFT_17160 [Lasiosphaeria ovina]|uniref:Secreted protein n=1 Tax=Lasiosphaeria ovina TaxID=92902 RepID=A0AAE0TWW8_9PEZI|nr:hypothetical protein B0T24DRAFT_17160 [Lasiosphaeria ovina]